MPFWLVIVKKCEKDDYNNGQSHVTFAASVQSVRIAKFTERLFDHCATSTCRRTILIHYLVDSISTALSSDPAFPNATLENFRIVPRE